MPPADEPYIFTGQYNLERFIDIANDFDLYVILRPGPFIDAERDMGGLPSWLLWNGNVTLRSMDPMFIEYVDKWFDVLLPKLESRLYINGGNIIMIQVENEYSYYGLEMKNCEKKYLTHLRDLIHNHLGKEVFLFSTDPYGVNQLNCSRIPGVYSTVDFGYGEVMKAFEAQRNLQPNGPYVNSEYYSGWLDYWGKSHSKVATPLILDTLDEIMRMGASVNVYMAHGGTNFGFGAGANVATSGAYQSVPTSYDYDAPISEAGDLTWKYHEMKKLIEKYVPENKSNITVSNSTKAAHGNIKMTPLMTFDRSTSWLSYATALSKKAKTFEEMGQQSGFLIYEKKVDLLVPDPCKFSADIRDRGYIFVQNRFAGILDRRNNLNSTNLSIKPGQTLRIVVENQGRSAFGLAANESKVRYNFEIHQTISYHVHLPQMANVAMTLPSCCKSFEQQYTMS